MMIVYAGGRMRRAFKFAHFPSIYGVLSSALGEAARLEEQEDTVCTQ